MCLEVLSVDQVLLLDAVPRHGVHDGIVVFLRHLLWVAELLVEVTLLIDVICLNRHHNFILVI